MEDVYFGKPPFSPGGPCLDYPVDYKSSMDGGMPPNDIRPHGLWERFSDSTFCPSQLKPA